MDTTPNTKRARDDGVAEVNNSNNSNNTSTPREIDRPSTLRVAYESQAAPSSQQPKPLAGRKITLMSRPKPAAPESDKQHDTAPNATEVPPTKGTSPHSSLAGAAAAAAAATVKVSGEGGRRVLSLGKRIQKAEECGASIAEATSTAAAVEVNQILPSTPVSTSLAKPGATLMIVDSEAEDDNVTITEGNEVSKSVDLHKAIEIEIEDGVNLPSPALSSRQKAHETASTTPNLSHYNLSACFYSVNLSPQPGTKGNAGTPIGFNALNSNQRLSMRKHSKLGYSIPQPSTDFAVLPPFFNPSAYRDLNHSITSSLVAVNQSNNGGTIWSPASGLASGLAFGSAGVLSAISPTVEGNSITSSPAYGIAATYGPRTPTGEALGLGFVSPHPMGSPSPFGDGTNGTAVTAPNETAPSPSLRTSHQATAFIPLPMSLQYPMFVIENHSAANPPSKIEEDDNGEETKQVIAKPEVKAFVLSSEDLFGTTMLPLTNGYEFDPRSKIGEGTYGAVYIGTSRPTPQRPTRDKVAIKMLKQLPNFEGFPITSVREISVHRHLRSLPESQFSKLLVADDLRFEYLDENADVEPTTFALEMKKELMEVNAKLPPSLQNLQPSRRGMVVSEVVVFVISPFVEHTIASMRQSLRIYGTAGSGPVAPTSGSSSLATAFSQSFDHHHSNRAPLCPLCLNEEFILFIFIQVLEGLNQLHKAHIMHRDIKEDNILITKSGDVKICDFGLAVPIYDRAKLTPSLIVMCYRPPEMLLGASQYSTAVDMWSAGCLLAQQFLGVPPFITKDGQPATELGQLKIIADVLGALPAKLIHLTSPDVRNSLFHHPQRDLIFEQGTFPTATARTSVAPLTIQQRFGRFRDWFEQMYKARKRAHINNVALEMPTTETLVAIFNMLSLDPANRPTAERMLKCTCSTSLARNASLMDSVDSNKNDISMRSRQVAQSLQQTRCWACKSKSRNAFMKEGISKLPPPKTHIRQRPPQ